MFSDIKWQIFREELVLEVLNLQEKFWIDMTSSLQLRILILSRKIEYFLLIFTELGEKS